MRVDSALVPPGLIASAKMHSIIFENDTLYIIPTGPGPASIVDYTKGLMHLRQRSEVLVNAAVTALINNYIKRIQKTEAEITSATLEKWSASKGALSFPLGQIQSFRATDQGTYVKIEIQAAGKKMKYEGSSLDKDAWLGLAKAIGKN